MFQNCNMVNNNIQPQNLFIMKMKLMNIESQFVSFLNQIQKMPMFGQDMIISDLSFQFIDFGIELLNLTTINNNLIFINNIKDKINNIIIKLNTISFNISNNNLMNNSFNNNSFNKHKYNVIIEEEKGTKIPLVCDDNNTVDEVIKKYLTKIGRNDLFDKDEKEFTFWGYKGDFRTRINTQEIKSKTLSEIANLSDTIVIRCYTLKNVIA